MSSRLITTTEPWVLPLNPLLLMLSETQPIHQRSIFLAMGLEGGGIYPILVHMRAINIPQGVVDIPPHLLELSFPLGLMLPPSLLLMPAKQVLFSSTWIFMYYYCIVENSQGVNFSQISQIQ